MTKLTRRGALGSLGLAATAAACNQRLEAPPHEGSVAFNHGVASGDPGADRVIIWTRVTPAQNGPVPLRWIVARNRDLTDMVQSGTLETTEARDYTVKVDVTGLRAGAPYFYGFLAGDQRSPVGKTRTLPTGRLEELKIAVASCASFPHGFFNAYEAIGAREDVDLVIHLGDYIYEYGVSGYGGDSAIALGRMPSPEIECKALQDYRQRHAQAKAEAELQSAHARAPWIVVWDDHEVANDSWMSGAENHQTESDGDFAARKQAALQAYYEWMPIRDPEQGRAFEAINRSFRFGDLMHLVMLETRLLGRTQPLNYATQMPIMMQAWDFTNPNAPRPLEAGAPAGAATRMLPLPYEEVNGQLRPVRDWVRVSQVVQNPRNPPQGLRLMPDVDALNAMLAGDERVLLGAAQEEWLSTELSGAGEVAWRVLGNQVLMAPIMAPDLSRAPPQLAQALERFVPGITQLLGFTAWEMPLTVDTWDGYPRARARVLDTMRRTGGAVLVLTGDSHAAWANELHDDRGVVAVELGATSITSPSDASYFTEAGIDFAAGVRARNPNTKWTDHDHRGFLLLTLTKREATAEFFAVSTVTSKDYEVTRAAAFTMARGEVGVGEIVAQDG